MNNPYQQHFKKMKKAAQNKSLEELPKRKRKKLPLGACVGFILTFGFILAAYNHYAAIESFVSKIEIGILGQASAQSGSIAGKNSAAVPTKKENLAPVKTSDAKPASSVTAGMTAEEIALFKSLEERKRQLDQREDELKKLESELQLQKQELEKRLAELDQLRARIANQLQERVTSDEEKVSKLVDFYSNMKPQKAAKVFETMNEDLAVEILQKMKKSSAAEIMNLIEADKARKLSEKFAGYRKN
jgi:flagellar motility protein MotE (MotC chaperone)